MTTVKNETTPNSDTAIVSTAPQTGPLDAAALLKAAKSAIGTLNAAEARGRKAMAQMVATFVEMGAAYIFDQMVTTELDAECKKHGIEPVKLGEKKVAGKPAPNIFLPLMSIVDGNWVDMFSPTTGKPVMDKDTGKHKQKWERNRSFEKYASVIRFFIHNEIGHEEVAGLLLGDKSIMVEGFEKGVNPRITDIVKADTLQQNGTRRAPQVWTTEAKSAVTVLKPVAVMPVSGDVAKTFTLSDGYTALIARVVDGKLEILFDSGLKGDALYRVINARTAEVTEALKAEIEEAIVQKAAA